MSLTMFSKAALALAFGYLVSFAASAPIDKRAIPASINAKFISHGKKYIGVATDQGRLTTGSNAAIIQADFGQVTPENSMKWDATEREFFNLMIGKYVLSQTRSLSWKLQLRWSRLPCNIQSVGMR